MGACFHAYYGAAMQNALAPGLKKAKKREKKALFPPFFPARPNLSYI